MTTPQKTLVELETRFWQSIVDADTDGALELLTDPALMVNARGSMKFGHEGYRKMSENVTTMLTAFELSDMDVVFAGEHTAIVTYHAKQSVATRGDGQACVHSVQEMNDSSTWVRAGKGWKCVLHTETPAE